MMKMSKLFKNVSLQKGSSCQWVNDTASLQVILLVFFFYQAAFEDEEGSQYFDSEDVFQQLNYECNDFGDDSGSDRDEDLVRYCDCH